MVSPLDGLAEGVGGEAQEGQLLPQAETAPQGRKVVQFLVGRDLFALPLEEVAQITRAEGIVPLPLAPEFIAGVVNLQGRLSSVATLGQVLTGKPGGTGGSLIVLAPDRKNLALLVDAILGIGEYTVLEEVGSEGAPAGGDPALIEGVFRRGPRLVSLVSAKRLISWIDGMMTKGEE